MCIVLSVRIIITENGMEMGHVKKWMMMIKDMAVRGIMKITSKALARISHVQNAKKIM